uniref:Amidohydrolase 3 n=1 Tax=Mycena chlorophos TaxID=658473 RepID=A0ABQ0M3F7_MYCCL|nr:amidohydrolase 3 [Mycena chlorophos]
MSVCQVALASVLHGRALQLPAVNQPNPHHAYASVPTSSILDPPHGRSSRRRSSGPRTRALCTMTYVYLNLDHIDVHMSTVWRECDASIDSKSCWSIHSTLLDGQTSTVQRIGSMPHVTMKASPEPPPPKRQWPSLRWVLRSIAAAFVVSRLYHLHTRQAYTICSQNASKSIYTVDAAIPQAECISVQDGRIAAVGDYVSVQQNRTWTERFFGPSIHTLSAGQIIVPGLADAHAHLLQQGQKMQLELDGAASIDEVVERIKRYILANPKVHEDPTRWIRGIGWDQGKWDGKFPTAADLSRDPLLRGRPILLYRVDVHVSWVSERVLELMGPLPDDSEIEGGSIVRYSDGNPTGIFLDNAMTLVPSPPWTPDEYTDYFNAAVGEALKYGLTSVHDAATEPDSVAFLKKMAEAGKLPIRLYLMAVPSAENFTGWEPSKLQRLVNHGPQGHLTLRSVKLFTDGALGSWGAALREPYSDKPETKGIMRSSPETMDQLIRAAWDAKLQVNVHCIGDRANEVVLDVFEAILAEEARNGQTDISVFRPRIEHAQIMQLSDLERISRLGVIPSVQPTHATSDMFYAVTRLGPERIRGAYAYRTLLELQTSPQRAHVLPLGSDFPVEGVNPLLGFYAAVSRLTPEGTSPHGDGGWFTNERLTREQALKGMTLDAAYASFAESELGSLSVSKRADFVVLDRDIMRVPVAEILQTRVLTTVVDGNVAWGTLGDSKPWWKRIFEELVYSW